MKRYNRKASQKRWNKAHPDKVKAIVKKWRENHREQYNEYMREWNAKNRNKVLSANRNRYWNDVDNQRSKMKLRYNSNKEKALEYEREYYKQHKDEVIKRVKSYSKTPQGKATSEKHRATRHRELQYNPLNEPFLDSTGHHVDKKNVIHIPEDIHKSIGHRQSNEKSMLKINLRAWDYLEASVL